MHLELSVIKTVDYLPTIESPEIAIDIETTWTNKKRDSANPFEDRIICISVSDGRDVWILESNFMSVAPLLVDGSRRKVIHNAIFDLQFLNHHLGVTTKNIWDTLIMERMIHTGELGVPNDLASVLARRLGVTLNKETRAQFANHSGQMTAEQINYAAEDALHLLKLKESQIKDISDMQLGKVAKLENAFTPVLVRASLDGIGFDSDLWEQYQKTIHQTAYEKGKELADMLGLAVQYDIFGETAWDFNFGSSDQIKRLFKDKFDVTLASASEESLKDLAETRGGEIKALIDLLLEQREWQNRKRWRYDEFVNPITGRIHPVWNQLQAGTGRMSCDNPNLQNVPNPLKAKPGDPNFRLLFPPDDTGEHVYIIADYAKQEPGILAHITGDENLINAYNSGDIYMEMAKIAYEKDEISKNERYDVKQGLLSAYYGAGIPKLANRMGISEEKAREFRDRMHKAGPKAVKWANEQEGLLLRRGFTLTLSGRRTNFLQLKNGGGHGSYYNAAINYPIQGSAADMFKLGAAYFYQTAVENYPTAAANIFVHDEMVVRCKREEAEEVLYQVSGAMEKAAHDLCPSVNIKADAHIHDRWEKD